MSTAQPAIPPPFRRSFPCPKCTGWMRTTRNPLYGVGLAVHQYVRICKSCEFTAFIPEALVRQYDDGEMSKPEVPQARSRISRFGRLKR